MEFTVDIRNHCALLNTSDTFCRAVHGETQTQREEEEEEEEEARETGAKELQLIHGKRITEYIDYFL